MTNAFGGFQHKSPLSNLSSSTSNPSNPHTALSSNIIRDYFGPIVQTVVDALQSRGPSTLQELISNIKLHCLKDWNEERGRLVDRLNGLVVASNNNGSTTHEELYYHGSTVTMNKARGSEASGYISDSSHVRAALIVLLQHSLIKVSGGRSNKPKDNDQGNEETTTQIKSDPTSSSTHYKYTFLYEKARLLPRYPRYVEHTQTTFNEICANIIECLLYNGRMISETLISTVWDDIKKKLVEGDEATAGVLDLGESNKALQDVVQNFVMLVEFGYIEVVMPIATNQDLEDIQNGQQDKSKLDDGIHGGEYEFNMNDEGNIAGTEKNKPSKKKRGRSKSTDKGKPKAKKQKKANNSSMADENYASTETYHPQIISLLSSQRRIVPFGSVVKVNIGMMHTSLKVVALSRLVEEMYPSESGGDNKNKKTKGGGDDDNLKYVGAIVKAALTLAARQEHAPLDRILGLDESEEEKHQRMAEWGTFSPGDIIQYLPDDMIKSLKSQVGGLNKNLSTLLVQLSTLQYPPIIQEVEEAAGHPKGGKFEICTRQLLTRLRSRIQHRILTTHHGLVAARIVSVLTMKGHCESDVIAEDAMVPAKEAREILHRLHREKYINLFDMHQTKTHNTGTAIFLWNVIPARLYKTVIHNVCLALYNLRLRRQHEVEVGKDWMDRASSGAASEENVHEEDKKKYHAFCKGLERLDCACLQLDETLMILKDF